MKLSDYFPLETVLNAIQACLAIAGIVGIYMTIMHCGGTPDCKSVVIDGVKCVRCGAGSKSESLSCDWSKGSP